MRFKRNKGLVVNGTNDWCMVYNFATGEVMTFGEDEIDRVRALVERINRALQEGSAKEELAALRWYHEHKKELRERETRKEECLFGPDDVDFLVETVLEIAEGLALKRLMKLSPLERKAFILNKVYLIPKRDLPGLLGTSDLSTPLNRARRKLLPISV